MNIKHKVCTYYEIQSHPTTYCTVCIPATAWYIQFHTFYHQISMAVNGGNVKAWIIKKWSARPPRQTLHSGLNLKFVMWSGQYEKNAQRKRRNAHLHSCEWDFFGSIQLSHFEWKQSSFSSIWTGRESEEIRVFDFGFNVWNVN